MRNYENLKIFFRYFIQYRLELTVICLVFEFNQTYEGWEFQRQQFLWPVPALALP